MPRSQKQGRDDRAASSALRKIAAVAAPLRPPSGGNLSIERGSAARSSRRQEALIKKNCSCHVECPCDRCVELWGLNRPTSPTSPNDGRVQTPFRARMTDAANSVIEGLELGGDWPGAAMNPEPKDFFSVLMVRMSDLSEDLRYSQDAPTVRHSIRQKLARIAATCEAWDKHLNS